MIFTFYKARGMAVGSSLVEEDKLDLAKKLEEAAKAKGVEFILPTDVVIADKFDENANNKVVSASEIPDGWMVRLVPPHSLAPSCSETSLTMPIWRVPFYWGHEKTVASVACRSVIPALGCRAVHARAISTVDLSQR